MDTIGLRFALLLAALQLAGCTCADMRPAYRYAPDYGVSSAEFRRSLDVLGHALVPGNDATLLANGDRFFPAMLQDIGHARHSVNMEMYIFNDDETGTAFAGALAAKAREGVEVRVLVDAFGDRMGRLAELLRAAGVDLRVYRPVSPRSLLHIGDRTHRKLLIIDGYTGFVGGVGIDDHWKGNARNPEEWRETMVRVEGPVTSQLQAIFAEGWLRTTGELLHGTKEFPELEPAGGMLAQAVGTSGHDANPTATLLFYMAIEAARERIWIQSAYFVPDAQLRAALLAAAARGVDVEVIVPGKNIDLGYIRRAARFLYGELLEGGVRLCEYRPTMMHSKVMVVDGMWTSIGSINFMSRSLRVNAEANLTIYDRGFAAEAERMFERDLANCDVVDAQRWRQRNPFSYLAGALFWLFSDLY